MSHHCPLEEEHHDHEHCHSEHSHEHDRASHDACEFTEKLFCAADMAWKELLIEKIKVEIEKTHGEHIAQLAKLIATTNSEKWKLKMEKKQKMVEFKEQLHQLFAEKHA